MLAITKTDLIDDELKREMEKDLPDIPHVFISSVTNQNLTELKDMIWENLHQKAD